MRLSHLASPHRLLALASLLVVACADAEVAIDGEAIEAEGIQGSAEESEPRVVEDGQPRAERDEETPVPVTTPLEALTVDTGLSDDAPLAGVEVQVFCTVSELAEGQDPPETSWRVISQPEGSEEAVSIEGDMITVSQVGVYGITCTIDETDWVDPTPAMLQVSPAAAVDIDTVITPSQLTAGEHASVSCSGLDALGNAVTEDWSLSISPQGAVPEDSEGVEVTGLVLKGLVAGDYDVACTQPDGSQDASPALLSVVHGPPHTLVSELSEDLIEAGGQTSLSCRAEDAYGNTVPDFMFSVAPLDNVDFVGLEVTSTVAGTYVIKCVPGDLGDWASFKLESALLEVVPSAPVSMEITLQPPKSYFATYELIQLVVKALDAYGNNVPDAPLAPFEVGPGEPGHHMPQPTAILFFEDGTYTVTARMEEDPEISDTIEIAIDGAAPTVTVTHPLRGATVVNSKPSVTVEGFAADTVTGIQSVTVNGQPTTLSESGDWSTIVIPQWGLNVIVVEAIDGDGHATVITQSFYFAEQYHPMDPNPELVPDAIKVWMDEAFIDDGVHNPEQPDDLATILESVLAGMDLGGLLPGGVPIGLGYELQVKNVSMGPPAISLDSVDGGLDMLVDIDGINVGVKLKGECKVLGIDLCPDFGGSVKVSQVQMDADLALSAWKGDLEVSLNNADLSLDGLDVDVNGILGWLFDWLIDFVVGLFADTIEDMLQSQIDGLLGDTITELVGALNLSETIEVAPILPGMAPISMTIEASIWNMAFAPEGGRVGLASRITTAKQVPQVIHGAISRGTCLKGLNAAYLMPGEEPFEIALYDDFINQAVTAMWYTGAMNVNMGPDEMAGFLGEGDALPIPVGGLSLQATLLLPPILNGCKQDGLVSVQIGDAFIDMAIDSPLFGDDGNLGAYISTEITAEFVLTESAEDGKEVGILLHEIADITFHWEYVPEFFMGSEDALEELIQTQLLGDLLDDLTQEPLLTLNVPDIDLGTLTPIVPTGTMISPAIESLQHVEGHTLLQGSLE